MQGTDLSLEKQLAELADELQALKTRVDRLTERVDDLSTSPRAILPAAMEAEVSPYTALRGFHAGELGTFLSTSSTVSFLLVIALALRTIVDQGLIQARLGSLLGMGYSGALVAVAFRRYLHPARSPTVYLVCGALLLFSIIWETHRRFGSLSEVGAYLLLGAVLAVGTFLGLRFQANLPLLIAVLGGTGLGMALKFPSPSFPRLAILLLAASGAAFLASRRRELQWIRWWTFGATILFFSLWMTRLNAAFPRNRILLESLDPAWVTRLVGLFFVAYFVTVYFRLTRWRLAATTYDVALPVANVLWAWWVLIRTATIVSAYRLPIGLVAVVLAVAHFALGRRLRRLGEDPKPEATSFLLAGMLLLLVGTYAMIDIRAALILAWSLVSLISLYLALNQADRFFRTTSHGLQVLACLFAFKWSLLGVGEAEGSYAAPVLLALGCTSVGHYLGSRRVLSALPNGSAFAPDPNDRAAVGALGAGLVYLFGLAQLLAFQVTGDDPNVFKSAQSVILCLGAFALILIGAGRGIGELFAVGVVVGAAAALKIFGHDLFHVTGIPLLVSVTSFGLTAAAASLAWNRWKEERGLFPGDG